MEVIFHLHCIYWQQILDILYTYEGKHLFPSVKQY